MPGPRAWKARTACGWSFQPGTGNRAHDRPDRVPLHGEGGFALADFKNQPEPVNLVPNPGFEAGTVGWRLAKGQSLDSQVFHSGRASVRLEVPGPQPASSNLEVVVPVKPNQRYRVGLWIAARTVGVCGAYSSDRDDRNRLTGKVTQLARSIPRQDGVWLPLSWEITTEPKTTRLSLRADIYRSTGTLWVDDFFVHEVNEGVYEAAAGETKVAGGPVTLNAALRSAGWNCRPPFSPTASASASTVGSATPRARIARSA